jgi:hypothetical protein
MGEQQQAEAKPHEGEQRKAGWLTRRRQRQRDNSARAAEISRRTLDAQRRNIDNSGKYGGR